MKTIRISLLIALIACISNRALADDTCETIVLDTDVEQSLATAGIWANLSNARGSLKYQSLQMLRKAGNEFSSQEPPRDLCPAHCEPVTKPRILFRSVPHLFLKSYSDAAKCDAHLKQTREKPLAYDNREFASIESLSRWFSEFSQGEGEDGADLYRRCDGLCSPQYLCKIRKDAGRYVVDAEVICGPARDKSDNQYKLSYGYRWTCRKRSSEKESDLQNQPRLDPFASE